MKTKALSKSGKKASRSLEHLPDLETASTGSYKIGPRTTSHLAISDVWSVLDKIRQSYKVDQNQVRERLRHERSANVNKVGSGHSTTSTRTDRSGMIYNKGGGTKLATLASAEQLKFIEQTKMKTMQAVLATEEVYSLIEHNMCKACVIFLFGRGVKRHIT